ncbi:DUF4878 domain-containing protein [Pleionea sediminis]|uniref:DUF4878 domain-containing protein n=1 Tax=Pleionea sediminis TaxID=2569479 RepID=UPI001184C241|nr:DUF4878 domain-containing protein [Pleionea sediminis]
MSRVLIVVLFSLVLIGCGVDQSDPKVVAKEYVEAVYYANLPRFKQLVQEKDYNATDDYSLFIKKDSTAKSNTRKFRGDISLVAVTDHYQKDDRARARVKVEFNNGERRLLSIQMHKVGENWYVNPMSWSRW